MAKKLTQNSTSSVRRAKRKRPGIHSKCKTSVSKNAKNYKKKYVGQGK